MTFPMPGEAPYGDKVKAYIDSLLSQGTGDMKNADNLAFLTDFAVARGFLDVYSTGETDTQIDTKIGEIPGGGGSGDMLAANNLSDLDDAPTARTNLGLGSAATHASTEFVLTDAQVVNVKDHGAVGDGTTNDTTAINAALTAGAGGTVWFPKGTYMVTPSALTALTTGTHIQGAGSGNTSITWRPSTATTSAVWYTFIAATGATDLEIDGITFSGNRSNGNHSTAGGAENFDALWFSTDQQRIHVHHCRFTNFRGDAIYVARSAGQPSDIAFEFNTVDDCGVKESGDGGNARQGVAFISCDNFRVCNNHFENLPSMGVDLEANTSGVDKFHNGVVSDNTFDTIAGAAVNLAPIVAADATDITIANNTLYGTAVAGFLVRGTGVSVTGNVAFSCTTFGLLITTGSTQVAVNGNALKVTGSGSGVAAVYVDAATYCAVVGNVLMGTAGAAGIKEASTSDHNFFAGNVIEHATRFVIVGANTTTDDFQPIDADLTAIAALTTTSFGRAVLALVDAAALRTAAGLGNVDNTADSAKTFNASAITAGTVATARLGSGTANSSTFLRGDQTYATPAAATTVANDALFDAKGDLAVGTGADTAAKLTVGANGAALVADSAQSTGIKWAALVKGDVGLGNVDNTSNATERAATATLTNKTLTSPVVNTPTGIVKGDVGLGNVDNTSNATERAATATLTNKTLTSPVVNTGVSGTAVDVDSTMAANSDTILPSQKAVKTALATKAPTNPLATDTLWAAKGDLTVGTANDTAAVLTVGSNAQVLTADSAQTTGVKWATPASGSVASDTLWDTAGDLAIGTGADTATKLVVGTLAGQALTADPNATNKLSWNYPQGVENAYRGSTGSLASTYDRRIVVPGFALTITLGTLRMVGITLPKGLPVTNITFVSGSTAGASMTHQWFGLFDSSRVVLAKTADDTSTAWGTSIAKTLAVTGGPFTTTYAGWYYVGVVVTGTTAPSLEGITTGNSTGSRLLAPITAGNSTVSLTDPASCTGTQTALTINAAQTYAEIS